jgi:hypothetical protein
MYAAGKTLAGIAEHLYEEKRKTPAAWKNHKRTAAKNPALSCVWEKSVIRGILRDEQYTGTYVAGKERSLGIGKTGSEMIPPEEWIRIPGHHEAIVSRELFDAVQIRHQVKRKPRRKREMGTADRYASVASALRGKVFCGNCHHSMHLSSTKNAAFHCKFTRSAADAACHHLRILKDELEEVVLESIRRQAEAILDSGLRAESLSPMRSPAEVEYAAKIEGLREEKQRLYESLVQGAASREEYRERKASIDAELARMLPVYEAILAESKKSIPDAACLAAARKALEDNLLTRELVDLLIDRILVVPDDRIEIVWKLTGFMDCLPSAAACCVAT